jgi:catechol 2,3-dioxygenase-like lactoylglutathione lyase family enzyme
MRRLMALGDPDDRHDRGVTPFVRFDHVQLAIPTGGEDRARQFYVDVLGFEEVPKPSQLAARGGLWLKSGDAVHLHLGIDPDFRPDKKAHPALRTSNYLLLLQRFRDRGLKPASGGPLSDGSERCYVFDPFGNRIEIIEEK